MELCACSRKMLDRNHATWVFRSQPCCGPACYQAAQTRYRARQLVVADMERRETATRVMRCLPFIASTAVIGIAAFA